MESRNSLMSFAFGAIAGVGAAGVGFAIALGVAAAVGVAAVSSAEFKPRSYIAGVFTGLAAIGTVLYGLSDGPAKARTEANGAALQTEHIEPAFRTVQAMTVR